MTVILTILKIIGIILLVIIALVLFILALVLFVPIRYRIKGDRSEPEDPPSAKIGVTYLLHIISAGLLYEDGVSGKYVKVFGIRIRPKDKDDGADATAPGEGDEAEDDFGNTPEDTSENVPSDISDDEIEEIDEDVSQNGSRDEAEDKVEGATEDIFDKIEALLDKAAAKYQEYCDKITGLKKKIRFWKKMADDKRNKAAFELIEKEILRLLRNIAPKKIRGMIHFGFEDPAVTGRILMYLAIVYPVMPKKLIIDPGFNDTDIYGNIDIKGYLCLVVVAYSLLRLIISKDCRRLWRLYKNREHYYR